MEIGVGAAVEEFVGEEGGGFVGGDAAVFLVPLFLVNALGAEAFKEVVAGFGGSGRRPDATLLVDALDEAFGDGFLDGDLVEGPLHGVGAFGVLDEVVEEAADAARGGDDGELAAPGGDGFGDAVELALVGVEGEFIQGDVAAFAGEGIGVGGEGIDAAGIGELEGKGGAAGIAVEEDFAEVGGAGVEEVGPVEAVFAGEVGSALVAGDDVGIEAGVGGADEEDEAEAVGVGEAGLAGFDAEFERGVVVNPVALGEIEVFVEGNAHANFGFSIFDLRLAARRARTARPASGALNGARLEGR